MDKCKQGSEILSELFEMTKAPQAHRILIVDDHPPVLEALRVHLADAGFDPVTCPDVKHAMALAEQMKPQLIILDLSGVGDIKTFIETYGDKIVMFSGAGPTALQFIRHKVCQVFDKMEFHQLLDFVKVKLAS